jgi:Protein of unknown function (DUF4232)
MLRRWKAVGLTISQMQRRSTVPGVGGLALAGLAALALGACGSSQTTSSAPAVSVPASQSSNRAKSATSAASAGACAGSQLKPAYVGTEGATGHMEVTLALRNVSAQSCTLRGYPAARLLDDSGRTLPMQVQRGGGFFPDTLAPASAVVLRPGAQARFGLSFVTNNEFKGAHTCRTAAVVMSQAPVAGAQWLRVSLRPAPRISPCGDQLVLSPVYS